MEYILHLTYIISWHKVAVNRASLLPSQLPLELSGLSETNSSKPKELTFHKAAAAKVA